MNEKGMKSLCSAVLDRAVKDYTEAKKTLANPNCPQEKRDEAEATILEIWDSVDEGILPFYAKALDDGAVERATGILSA